MRDLKLSVGDTVEIVQRYTEQDRYGDYGRGYFDPDGKQQTRIIGATVHYIRKRGDLQVVTENGTKYWVGQDGYLRRDSIAGTAFVRVPDGR